MTLRTGGTVQAYQSAYKMQPQSCYALYALPRYGPLRTGGTLALWYVHMQCTTGKPSSDASSVKAFESDPDRSEV